MGKRRWGGAALCLAPSQNDDRQPGGKGRQEQEQPQGDRQPVAQEGEGAVAEWVEVTSAMERLTYEQDRRILRLAQKYLLNDRD